MHGETKRPTWDDYLAYGGEHCLNLWQRLGDDWRCPVCGRSKFETLPLTRKIWYPGLGPIKNKPYMGWKSAPHVHHYHQGDLNGFRSGPTCSEETVSCDQCNSVDVTVKRRFRDRMDSGFSFSPREIRRIAGATAHSPHVWEIYLDWLRPTG